VALLVALAGVPLGGCETSAEKSARLERAAVHRGTAAGAAGLSIVHPSRTLKVTATALVGSSEGAAAAVTIRNTATHAVHDVPIELVVRSPAGARVYSNSTPGLAHTLVSVGYIGAGARLTWVNDQLPPAAAHGTASATVGEAPSAAGPAPLVATSGVHAFEDPTNGPGLEGTVVNRSHVAQQELGIYAVARSARGVVAAGRAVVAQLPAGGSSSFQLFWVGNPKGAHIELVAPPTSLR
jgi:hypothetical protein